MLNNKSYEGWMTLVLGIAALALVSAVAWPAHAGGEDEKAELPVVEATIPDTLHPNDVGVTPTDRAIAARVRATLVAALFVPIDADAIAVQARYGRVTLFGSIRSESLKEEVSLRVQLIPGIKAVDNKLRVEPKSERDR